MNHLCFPVLCLLCLCVRLFICALWSPAGKRLTPLLSFVVSNCEFVTFHWYPRSGVVLDCIDSWSLYPYLLWNVPVIWSKGLNFLYGVQLLLCAHLIIFYYIFWSIELWHYCIYTTFGVLTLCNMCVICNSSSFHSFICKPCTKIVRTLKMTKQVQSWIWSCYRFLLPLCAGF